MHEETGKNLRSERNVHLNRLRSGTLQLKMADKGNNFQDEQRAYCKIRALLGVAAPDIKSDLDNVYGDSALSYATVRRWVRLFTSGREATKDEARPGRPVTTMTDGNIAAVKKAVEDDARCTVEEIGNLCGINSSSVFQILTHVLKLRKVCARWIPHLLTEEQKRERVRIASQLLDRYKNADQNRMNEIVTGDETWVYFYEPDGKEKNKVWVGENDERPQIARRARTSKRIMYALFFDCQGMVARIPIPEGRSVTGIFYRDSVLSAVVSHYTTARPGTGVRGIKLLHDNAPAHKSVVVKSYLSDNSIETLPHPAYSPDLAPCDFWLNPYIKNYMRGRRFESRHAVGSALFQCLNTIPKGTYRKAFSDWIQRLEKCIQVKGEYFEGLV